MISFFIPFYNEVTKQKNLNSFLKELNKFIKKNKNNKNQFILYDDGSNDETLDYLESFKKKIKKKNVNILRNYSNKGVGFSFKNCLKKCKTRFIFFLPGDHDLDFKYLDDINSYTKLDLTLFFPINFEKYSSGRYFLTMLFRIIYGVTFGIRVNYIQSPCLYSVKELLRHKFNSDRFSIWPEINTKLLKSNIKFTEVPVKFKKKSIIDRTVSFKNLLEVILMYLLTFFEIKIFRRRKYSQNAKKLYL